MNSRYYLVLGLKPNASQAEVRRQYRKLVVQYHPDKNNTPGAAERFIAINEAYEILIGRRQAPVSLTDLAGNGKSRSTINQEERMKEAMLRYRKQQMREHIENELFFRKLTSGWRMVLTRCIVVTGILIASAILIESFAPFRITKDRVIAYNNGAYPDGARAARIAVTEKGDYVWLQRIDMRLFALYPDIEKYSSYIFHEPVALVSVGKTDRRIYETSYSYFNIRWCAILFFLLPLGTYFYRKRTLSFSILYYFNTYIVGSVLLTFLIIDYRWLHLLTFGSV